MGGMGSAQSKESGAEVTARLRRERKKAREEEEEEKKKKANGQRAIG